MLRKIFATATFMYAVSVSQAQLSNNVIITADSSFRTAANEEVKPEKNPITISGSADVYYRNDFKKQAANNYTSFTGTQNSFALGMASVKFDYTGEKTGFVADFGFGNRAEEFAYNDNGLLAAVKQLYFTYKPVKDLTLTAGTWATHVGYELLDPQLNRNYSMSNLFTNGPFSHTGIKAEYSKGKHGFMAGISNATDYRVSPQGFINKKFFIAQYSVQASDAVKLYFNFVEGKSPDTSIVNQVDMVATAAISNKFDIGFNATLNSTQQWDNSLKQNMKAENWWGIAGYFNYNPNDWMGLTLRSEIFNDTEGAKGFNTSIFTNTLSANFKVEGFTFIPEIRVESAGKAIYYDASGIANQKTAASFILAAVYSF